MMVINNGRVVGPRGVLDGHCVLIEGGTIRQVAPSAQVLWPPDAVVVDARGGFVAPGFVDLHVHGGAGRDTMEAKVETLAAIARFHARGGTTAWTPTIMTDTGERITAALDAVAQAMAHDFGGARILGAHVEGPYLSCAKCGAQPAGLVRSPAPEEYLPWLEREGLITQMTLAPELPGALTLIEELLAREIIPSGGHTAASHEQTRAAIECGLCQATHLFNAMSAAAKVGAYRVPGAVETFLTDNRVMAELIADGRHVHPELLKLAVRAKGVDGVCLVTDATAGAGLAEGTAFVAGETRGVVRDGVGMTMDGGALVGSVATMMDCVRTMVAQAGVALVDAVRMASLNPARALGMGGRKGSLEPRKDADVVIFSEAFTVTHTLIGGRLAYEAS